MKFARSFIATVLVGASCVLSCTPSGAGSASGTYACGTNDAIVAMSDYDLASCVGVLSLDGGGVSHCGVDLGSDPALATSAGRTFYVARLQDTIIEIDPRCGTKITQMSAHDPAHDKFAANPQDVAVAPSGELWVPRYNVPSIAILDTTGAITTTIDLTSYDPDGNPDASLIDIAMVGGAAKAFVMLERLDDTQNPPKPKLTSQILRIDVATRAIEAAIDLAGKNPFGMVDALGALWLAEPGDFYATGESTAGVERFDPQTSTSALLVKESDLGASVAEVAVTAGCGAAIVADASAKNKTSLVTFDPTTGAVLTTTANAVLGPTDDYYLEGMLWRGDVLLVGDRQSTSRGYAVHAFDREPGTCILHERADAVFLPQKPVALRATGG